jgi:hypothetical protein
MKHCIDEGTLQAWFDGELAANEAANVAAHLNTCGQCAAAAKTVEAESLRLSEALAPEFGATVPTEALRERIDRAVAGLQPAKVPEASESRWRTITEFFAFRPLAYASVAAMILVAAIIGFVYLKKQSTTSIANNNPAPLVTPAPQESPERIAEQPNEVAPPLSSRSPDQVMITHKAVRRTRPAEPDARSQAWQERQYEKAIARLNEALKTQPAMRPALQVEYEYNIAVIDNAIATTREAAKKNPKDPLANQFMLAAYQSKVDFMNQIADARGLEK